MIFGLFSIPTLASKSRYESLGNTYIKETSDAVVKLFEDNMGYSAADDPYEMFDDPSVITTQPSQVFIEAGIAKNYPVIIGGTEDLYPNAEAGFITSKDDTSYALYLGHQYPEYLISREGINNGFLGGGFESTSAKSHKAANPVYFAYGKRAKWNWAVGYHMAGSKSDTGYKDDFNVINFGARNNEWKISYRHMLNGKATGGNFGIWSDADNDDFVDPGEITIYTSNWDYGLKSFSKLGIENKNSNQILFFKLFDVKHEYNARDIIDNPDLSFKLISSTSGYSFGIEKYIQKQGAHLFYGTSLNKKFFKYEGSDTINPTDKSTIKNSTEIPIWFGFESKILPWLVVRSTLFQQTFLSSYSRVDNDYVADTQSSGKSNSDHSTRATLGAGILFGKLKIDGLVSAASTGTMTFADSLLSNISLTYKF